jgi:hypothetical protein
MFLRMTCLGSLPNITGIIVSVFYLTIEKEAVILRNVSWYTITQLHRKVRKTRVKPRRDKQILGVW